MLNRGAISVIGLATMMIVAAVVVNARALRFEPAPVFLSSNGPDPAAVELDRRFRQDVAPVIHEFCIGCHAGEEPSGDLSLDRLAGVQSLQRGEFDFRHIRELVATSEMPPKRKPQPTEHQRLILTQWLDAMIDYVPLDAAIDPGWFTPHRLNRNEYRNTLRDLLGIDPAAVDIAAKLPPDDTGYGFDNIADVLSVSPLAVEQYLGAAERAIDAALGPVVMVGDHPHTIRPLSGGHGQPLGRGGFYLFANGAVSGRLSVPVTGEYIIRVHAWETRAGDESARMSVRLDGKSIGDFEVSGTRGEPQEFVVRLRCERGDHEVAAHFTNDLYIPDRADRNLGVESITIAGPVEERSIERPRVWQDVFAAQADSDDDTRATQILQRFASRAYRRPATEPQVQSLLRVYRDQRSTGHDFEPSVRAALTAALVSPDFLFRTVHRPGSSDPDTRYELDGYELASRLAYFLWSSMPDPALLASAESGELVTDAGLSRQVRRMLADPKSQAFIDSFSGQWLQLRALDRIEIDQSRFPEYGPSLREDMRAEATLFFGDVLASDRSVLAFVESRESFLNERLALYYNIPDVHGNSFRKVTLPEDSPRGGVLTMGAVLTLTSNTTRTSPVKRGLFVLDQILGTPPPPPPPDIPPLEQAKASDPEASMRERLAAHTSVPSCAACHNRLDPLGLTFENFDAIGRWREFEHGRPIDSSGTLPGGVVLRGTTDLKRNLLERSDQFIEALCARVLTYAVGRGMEPFDRPAIRRIAQRTRANGDRFQALIESVVLSDTFRSCRGRTPRHE